MRRLAVIMSVLGALMLSACSSASFAVANAPVAFADVKKIKDIAYGDGAQQKLDIYAPEAIETNAPVLVFFYGGRWTFGNKEQYAFAALPFVKKGYIVVIPDYAKYPDVKFPAFVEDGAKAVSWVHDNIGTYKGDNKRLYLSGHSSGAHIASLVSVDPQYLKAVGKDRSVISAFAGLAGPYDFIPEDPDLKDMFGPPENYKNIQVPTFVDGKQPPMYLLHGGDDKDVILRNLNRLRDKIEDKGGIVETKIYDGIDHKEIVGALSWVWDDKAPVADDMDAFMKKYRSKP
jgi:acetyl esterase/lipase